MQKILKLTVCFIGLIYLAGCCVSPNEQLLFSKPQQVTKNVWSAIGEPAPPSYENSGHNNNLSFIITSAGVVVINASDSYLLAKSLHTEIKKITKQPVKYVVLENGQGHAMLGMSYWQDQGIKIIAQKEAADEIKKYGKDALKRMQSYAKEKAEFTKLSMPDEIFTDKKVIELGGETIELLKLGAAHSPGDISVWLPKQQLVIAGDIAFHQRLLAIFEHTNTKLWLKTWDKLAALNAKIVIPGHGVPTDMKTVTKYTVGYLTYMRAQVAKIIDEGGDLLDAYKIDQSAYKNLATFEELNQQNAGIVYREMEFDF